MDHQARASRRVCDDLARALMSRDGSRLFHLITRLSQNGAANSGDRLRPVGPGGNFEQCLLHRGEKKKNTRRVLWLGESAARGYFFDPAWTPALALQQMIDSILGSDRVEVVDLAQSSIGLSQLLDLTVAAMDLQPDVCVVFAGNNWNPWKELSWTEARQVAEILSATGSWSGVAPVVRRLIQRQTTLFVDKLGYLADRWQIPFVLVVPEFNLLDWQEAIRDRPFIDGAATEIWLRERLRMENALAVDDWPAASDAAHQMVRLDDRTMPHGLRTLALSKQRSGDTEQARRLLEQARDTEELFPLPSAPRCSSATQDCLRTLGFDRGLHIIDLPARLAESSSGGIPDKAQFLDYCHLTGEGLQLLSASVAERVVPWLAGPQLSWHFYMEYPCRPSAVTEGAAHLLAANHNFCWGQSMAVVEYHCRLAAAVPQVHEDIRDFASLFARKIPYVTSRAFAELTRRNQVPLKLYFNSVSMQPRPREPLIDALVLAMEDQGRKMEETVVGIRMEEAITCEPTDLLDGYHEESSYADFTLPRDLALHRSYKLSSQFTFPMRTQNDITLTVTYRTPCCESTETLAKIAFNDCLICQLPPTTQWRTESIAVSKDALRAGVNTLRVHWPLPAVNWVARSNQMREAIDRSPTEAARSLWPICGEVARASVALRIQSSGLERRPQGPA